MVETMLYWAGEQVGSVTHVGPGQYTAMLFPPARRVAANGELITDPARGESDDQYGWLFDPRDDVDAKIFASRDEAIFALGRAHTLDHAWL